MCPACPAVGGEGEGSKIGGWKNHRGADGFRWHGEQRLRRSVMAHAMCTAIETDTQEGRNKTAKRQASGAGDANSANRAAVRAL